MTSDLEREYIHQEIVEQAEVARRCAAAAGAWPDAPGRVVLAGAGDSLAAAELATALLPERRLEPLPALRASAVARELGRDDALIGISVSGRTPRVVEAVARARRAGAATIGVTDDPTSALAETAQATWPIQASPVEALQTSSYTTAGASVYVGYHHDVAQTKTFLAALLTLVRAAGAHAADRDGLAALIERLCAPAFVASVRAAAEGWAAAGQAFVLASGSALPLARFAAYKLFEFDRTAHFTDVEEYCHTHYFITRPGDAVLFVIHDADSAARAAEVAPVLSELFGARIAVVRSDDVAADAPLAPDEVVVPAGAGALQRHVALLLGVEWATYLWGRIGAPDINTFHAGYDAERLVAGSARTIRGSQVR